MGAGEVQQPSGLQMGWCPEGNGFVVGVRAGDLGGRRRAIGEEEPLAAFWRWCVWLEDEVYIMPFILECVKSNHRVCLQVYPFSVSTKDQKSVGIGAEQRTVLVSAQVM